MKRREEKARGVRAVATPLGYWYHWGLPTSSQSRPSHPGCHWIRVITQIPQVSCILASNRIAWQGKRWEEKDQEQGIVALNRHEVTASFLTALAIAGATHTAFHSMLLGEHRVPQTLWFSPFGLCLPQQGPGARPAAQPSALVPRYPIGRAAQGKLAALHGSEGWHSNRLLKKKEKCYSD